MLIIDSYWTKKSISLHRLWATVVLCFACMAILSSQNNLPQVVSSYTMVIELDTDTKKIGASTTLTWTNPSADTVDHMLFHMYYNAFKNSRSTFMTERGMPEFLTKNIGKDCGWGWVEIDKIIDNEGNDLTPSIRYVQTDDGNTDDQTVLRIDLKRPLLGDESITLTYEWSAKIPKTMPRTGYNKEFYFLAQWFPKLGVYETKGMRYAESGGWNCHQYHSSGEYYADFSDYDVSLTVPLDYEVAASGQLTGQSKKGDNKTWRFQVENVIDFTWSASPHFILTEDKYKDVEIKLYTYPEKEHTKERYLPITKYAMKYLEEKLGPYPYPTLTIIDPPIHGLFTGGMEYPTLVTSFCFNSFPAGAKTAETLVVHEYIHQYFMQMVATHEVEDPWMDEGMTSYYEGKIMDSFMDECASAVDVLFVCSGNKEWNRAEFFASPANQETPNVAKSWEFDNGYGPISYNKTSLWLETLERLVGVEVMESIMKTYFQRWQYRHPCRNDFIDVVNELVSQNDTLPYSDGMDWYFNQVLYGTDLCDYAVTDISNKEARPAMGYLADNDNCIEDELLYTYNSTATVRRLEGMRLPVEVKFTFEDDSSEWVSWSGDETYRIFEFNSDSRLVTVEVDPHRKLYIDKNFINNTKTIESSSTGVSKLFARLVTTLQHVLESLSFLV